MATTISAGTNPYKLGSPPDFGTLYSGRALDFDGVTDYVSLAGLTVSANTITYSCWVKSTQSSSIGYLLDFDPNRSILAFNNATNDGISLYDGSSWTTFGTASDGIWHHIVFVLDNTSAKAYKDGIQLGSTETILAFDISDTSNGIIVGRHYNSGSGFFDGELSNIQI